jgi:hypothetical protein
MTGKHRTVYSLRYLSDDGTPMHVHVLNARRSPSDPNLRQWMVFYTKDGKERSASEMTRGLMTNIQFKSDGKTRSDGKVLALVLMSFDGPDGSIKALCVCALASVSGSNGARVFYSPKHDSIGGKYVLHGEASSTIDDAMLDLIPSEPIVIRF